MTSPARAISDMSPSEISAIVRPMATPECVGEIDTFAILAHLHEEKRRTKDYRSVQLIDAEIDRTINYWEASR